MNVTEEKTSVKNEQNTAQEGFVVMAKPVGALCNLRCSYCYYLGADARTGIESYRMSDELLERYIKGYIKASPGPVVQFNWHGGEPTLAGKAFFEKAVSLQKKYLPEGFQCINNIQTNGVLIDEDFAEFLKANAFDVGLSTDGAECVHDHFRKHPDGSGSYAETVRTAEILRKKGISADLLCTVTKRSTEHAKEVYAGLKALQTGWIQFIPIVVRDPETGDVTEDSVTPEGYGKFLCDIFDEWIFRDLGSVDIQLFAETALVLAGGSSSLCTMAPRCGRVPIVEHDGSVYSCDHFVDRAHYLGNITETDLDLLVDSEKQRTFGDGKQTMLTKKCRTCPYLAICNGGCLKDRFAVTEDGEEGQYYLCEGLKKYFGHAVPYLQKMMAMSRRGMHAEAIKAALKTEKKAELKRIGRNDLCPCGSGKKYKTCCMNRLEELMK